MKSLLASAIQYQQAVIELHMKRFSCKYECLYKIFGIHENLVNFHEKHSYPTHACECVKKYASSSN